MIPFLFGTAEDGSAIVWPIDRPSEIEALAHDFIDRGGRYIVTEATSTHIRIAAVVEGKDDSVHELTSQFAARGSAVETIDRLICDSIKLISPVH